MSDLDRDYSLYLVTGRELLPPGVDYYRSLELSLRDGHVTMVQLREKSVDNGEFLEIAQRSLRICDQYRVPMLVNDNLAVALALPARVGLHIGQSDLPAHEARRLLGPQRLLGLSVKNVQQGRSAVREGIVDYVGVGPVYATLSKAGVTEDDALGPRGAREVLEAMSDEADRNAREGRRPGKLPSVLIGGINQSNAMRTLFGTTTHQARPDGIAVISAIVARRDPDVAAAELRKVVSRWEMGFFHSYRRQFRADDEDDEYASARCAFGCLQHLDAVTRHLPSTPATGAAKPSSAPGAAQWLVSKAASLLGSRAGSPVVQTLTSHVSANLSANALLCFGASPIMSERAEEANELGGVDGAVVLNIGTVGPEARKGMRAVGTAANRNRTPVLLDPVGVGASAFRKAAVDEILNHTQVTLLKGNAAELSSIAGTSEVASRGVDAGEGALRDPVSLVRRLALRERCLVLLSGRHDYLSNGRVTVRCANGVEMLGKVTATGCSLGVLVAAGMAFARTASSTSSSSSSGGGVEGPDAVAQGLDAALVDARPELLFAGALMGLLSLTIASELAVDRPEVRGPGTFVPALLDALAGLTPDDLLQRAQVEVVDW